METLNLEIITYFCHHIEIFPFCNKLFHAYSSKTWSEMGKVFLSVQINYSKCNTSLCYV